MAVIILGIDKPEECYSCEFCKSQYCTKIRKETPRKGIHNDCPMIEIPDKHGEIIDADTIHDEDDYKVTLNGLLYDIYLERNER